MQNSKLLILLIVCCFCLFSCTGNKATKAGRSTLSEEGLHAVELQKHELQDDIEEVESNDVPTLISQAEDHIQNKKHKKALAYLSKAKKLKPDDVEIRKMLVNVYREYGKTHEEITELKGLIVLKPDNDHRIRYAQLLREKEAFDEAINTIEDVRAVDPENITALLELGKIHKDQNMYKEAIEVFREITYIDSKNALAKFNMAEIYLAQSKPLWADKYYKDALKMDPKLGIAEYGLAKIAKMRSNKEKYQFHISKAYKLNPDIPEIKDAYNQK